MRNCVARQKLQHAAGYHGSLRQCHSRTALFFQSLATWRGRPGCGVLQRHVAAYPVGLSRRAQQGTVSCPPSSRCVAKEGRRVWGVARFAHPGATRRPFHHALADGLVQIGPLSTGPWMTRPARDHDHPCALPARVAVCPAHAALDDVPIARAPSPRELNQNRAVSGAQPRRRQGSRGAPRSAARARRSGVNVSHAHPYEEDWPSACRGVDCRRGPPGGVFGVGACANRVLRSVRGLSRADPRRSR